MIEGTVSPMIEGTVSPMIEMVARGIDPEVAVPG
jgi:hypothetical protein